MRTWYGVKRPSVGLNCVGLKPDNRSAKCSTGKTYITDWKLSSSKFSARLAESAVHVVRSPPLVSLRSANARRAKSIVFSICGRCFRACSRVNMCRLAVPLLTFSGAILSLMVPCVNKGFAPVWGLSIVFFITRSKSSTAAFFSFRAFFRIVFFFSDADGSDDDDDDDDDDDGGDFACGLDIVEEVLGNALRLRIDTLSNLSLCFCEREPFLVSFTQ